MHQRLILTLVTVLLMGLTSATMTPIAHADTDTTCVKTDRWTAECDVTTDGSVLQTQKSDSTDVTPPPPSCRNPATGDDIPCTKQISPHPGAMSVTGRWHAGLRCYVFADDTRGWHCRYLDGTTSDLINYDPTANPPPPDPRTTAWKLIAQVNLQAGQIGLVPTSEHSLLGLPTWLWVANPGPRTTGPITRSTTTGGYTVTINAHLSEVSYDMGDATTVTCAGTNATGTPYHPRYGTKPSPTCGHLYTEPGTHTVTATSLWTVDWYGVGQAGTITLTLQRTIHNTTHEGHAVVR